LTFASAVHRQQSGGVRATGSGIGVAVIDTGFYRHPYFADHGYDIQRVCAEGEVDADLDEVGHGTPVLAPLLACAPDVRAYGIKMGMDQTLAIARAAEFPDIRVISMSQIYPLPAQNPDYIRGLQLAILDRIANGVTVVAAAGDFDRPWFPAAMPEVIAVGAVEIQPEDGAVAFNGSASFTSTMFTSKGSSRAVPDLCGIGRHLMLPFPPGAIDMPEAWDLSWGTSFAAPQIAGIAALLLQKNPDLTPADIRHYLCSTAVDVQKGAAAGGTTAGRGRDPATGDGLVHALEAWQSVKSPGDR
jgi:subtilisin family serine protease